jgi:Putative prokaryotic signal transducing protein
VSAVLMKRSGRVIPFRKPSPPTADADGLVEVHRCDRAEAMVVKSLLESDGIPTLLRSRLAHSVHPFTVGAQGEVVILVPARAAARAARLLFRLISGGARP